MPDALSADADPSSGYIIYDSVNEPDWNEPGWNALGGTSGAAPLWAAVLADVASADGNTAGYGVLNPALYQLAQQSPNTYLNDVTSGNNDYNATNGGQYAAMTGYDMATGLGTPVASELASGLTAIPLDVGGVGVADVRKPIPDRHCTLWPTTQARGPPRSASRSTRVAQSCTQVDGSTPIGPTLPAGSHTLVGSSCSGATLSGTNEADYVIVYTSAPGDFHGQPRPVDGDGFERLHDLRRRHAAHRHSDLLRLRQQRDAIIADKPTNLLDDRHDSELSVGQPVLDIVLRGGRSQLLVQLCRGLRNGNSGPADEITSALVPRWSRAVRSPLSCRAIRVT